MAAHPPAKPYVWQTCLDLEGQDATHYPDTPNTGLLGFLPGTPRRVLELGCSTGAFGAELKKKFPEASVVGVEAGRSAAEIAAKRLDRVVCTRLEAFDLAAEGFAHGEFDAVIAADILEHLVNPWELLVRLKPFLAKDAIVMASIPNVRNLMLVEALLLHGRWTYADRGLLDVTHLRFFTLESVRRLFSETGYRVESHAYAIAPALAELHRSTRGQAKVTIDFGRLKIADATPAEVDEYCAVQFLVRARPA